MENQIFQPLVYCYFHKNTIVNAKTKQEFTIEKNFIHTKIVNEMIKMSLSKRILAIFFSTGKNRIRTRPKSPGKQKRKGPRHQNGQDDAEAPHPALRQGKSPRRIRKRGWL